MRIGIVTYFFHPVLNPRAFRALELAKEFSRRGHEVIIYIPDLGFDYTDLIANYGFKINQIEPGFYLNKKSRIQATVVSNSDTKIISTQAKKSIFKKFKMWLIQTFYPGGFNFEFAFTCSKFLSNEKKSFDLMISVGLPICSHLAVARTRRKNKNLCTIAIADYGDPYSFSKIIEPPYFHRWLERRMLNNFNFILTPTQNGIASFLYFKNKEYIKVIPQGFDFSSVKIATLNSSIKPIHFIFAGNFYKDVRNPKEFLDYLCSLTVDFKFTVYVNTADTTNIKLLESYTHVLKDKLEIRPFLERLDCIYEMSKADFLVNIANTSDQHTPSKLIDYKLARRPIYSYTPGNFQREIIESFLNRDYRFDIAPTIDLNVFDIRNVASSILELMHIKLKP